MIPLGVFHRIHLAHLRWLARRHDRLALKEANVHVPHPPSPSTSSSSSASSGSDSGASTESEEASGDDGDASISDDEIASSDSDKPIVEEDAGEDGVMREAEVVPLLSSRPEVKTKDSVILPWARNFASLVEGGERWNVKAMQPGCLWFIDIVSFDFKVRGKRPHVYVMQACFKAVFPHNRTGEVGFFF